MKKIINILLLLILCSNVCVYAIEFDTVDTVQNIDYSEMTGGFECITYEAASDLYAVAPMSLISGNTAQAYFTLYNTLMPNKLTFDNIVTKVTVDGTIYRCAGEYTVSVSADTQNEAVQEAAQIYYGFISDFPELFYLNSIFLHSYNSYTSQVTISPVIGHDLEGIDVSTKEGFDDMMNKYYALENKIEEIADEIYFEGMTDLDKLLLTHDYITDNCVYYLDENGYMGDWFSHNAYGVIMNKQAVCQGYAYSYKAILKKLGYDSNDVHLVMSHDLKHMWNLVKLDGKWYHVDSTWDDPLFKDPNTGGYNMNNLSYQITIHSYFLIDTATNYSNRNNYSFDMSVWGYDDSVIDSARYTSYLNGYIFNGLNAGTMSGKVTYDNEQYICTAKNGFFETYIFMFDSLKSTKFAITQPFNSSFELISFDELQLASNLVVLWGGYDSVASGTGINFYVAFYDETDKMLSVQKTSATLQGPTMIHLSAISSEIPENASKIKIIPLIDNLVPCTNGTSLERN